MKPTDDIRIKKRMVEAYQHDIEVDIPPGWQQRMMRKIREIGPLNQVPATGIAFYELVWKMVPVFSILLVILITGMLSMNLSLNSAIGDFFMNDPVAVIYNGIFWG